MSVQAGFAEIDITPPVGVQKVGWPRTIVTDHVLDLLYARAAVFETSDERIAFIQLDTLFVPAELVERLRAAISAEHGFPGEKVMVCATHNHAGPAIYDVGFVRQDPRYVDTLADKVVAVFGSALGNRRQAEIGFGRCFEFRVAHNRRVVMRDGTVRTHGSFSDPQALYVEGPIDPEVAVLAARSLDGKLLGVLVNFTCHPTHHGGDTALSAGYPGALADELKSRGCGVPLFLQGASGNVHFDDPTDVRTGQSLEGIGQILAEDVMAVLAEMRFSQRAQLAGRASTVLLPCRTLTDQQIHASGPGAQRFVEPELHDCGIPELVDRINQMKGEPAEVQVLRVNDVVFAANGGECFVELGLAIKQRSQPLNALVVCYANGRLGYIPTQDAFRRGGYETTFSLASWLAPEAGDILVDATVDLIGQEG
ncbi:MAG TPA: hypothetical protein VMZ31_17220 [Phycisphaerae bacterium]|nr:hypothetical protein [Phycisphaerae bacterium]